jgi:hypothetical protein
MAAIAAMGAAIAVVVWMRMPETRS